MRVLDDKIKGFKTASAGVDSAPLAIGLRGSLTRNIYIYKDDGEAGGGGTREASKGCKTKYILRKAGRVRIIRGRGDAVVNQRGFISGVHGRARERTPVVDVVSGGGGGGNGGGLTLTNRI